MPKARIHVRLCAPWFLVSKILLAGKRKSSLDSPRVALGEGLGERRHPAGLSLGKGGRTGSGAREVFVVPGKSEVHQVSIVGEPGCAWMALWSRRLEVWAVSETVVEL